MADAITKEIDRASRELLREPRRTHLGASSIGNRCIRAVWYGFRWAYDVDHIGRMRRLFNRGHEEEDRIIRWLRAAGYEVREYAKRLVYHEGSDSYAALDWDEPLPEGIDYVDDVSEDRWHIERAKRFDKSLPKDQRLVQQWGFVDHDGHFSGSSDGKVRGPKLPDDGWGGTEYKTHNDKSFKAVRDKGVLSAKPGHWVQMQVYMHYLKLNWCLYVAVNKNDDDIHCEIVTYRPEIAQQYVDVAKRVIDARQAPRRLSEDASWYECKFCDFREICHKGEAPERNCRSCQYAEPVADKGWRCNAYGTLIPSDFIPKGCDNWQGIQ